MTATTAMPRPTRPFWSLDRAMAFLEEGLMVIHARHGKSNSVDTPSRPVKEIIWGKKEK
jgi:hypothetical protein